MDKPGNKQSRVLTLCFIGALLAFTLVFFCAVHPLVLLDADDWTYASYTRFAVPSLKYWNPARILPEVLMAAVSSFSVYALMPLTGDYLRALSLGYGMILSLFVTGYVLCFLRLAEKRFNLSRVMSILASVLFLLFHFLIFRTDNSNNSYMFRSCNVTCVFYYTIPGLLNASLVMFFLSDRDADSFLTEGSTARRALLILLCYFALFSNLFESFILAVYAGCTVLFALIRRVRQGQPFAGFIRQRAASLAILVLWAVSAVFELFGERAGAFDATRRFSVLLGEAVGDFVEVLQGMNRLFLLCAAGLVLLAVIAASRKRKKGERIGTAELFAALLLCGVLTVVYTLLLAAKTAPKYVDVYRADLIFGLLFFAVVTVSLCAVAVLHEFPRTKVLLPLVIVLLLTDVNTPLVTFAESNMIFTPHETVEAMSRDVVDQIVQADRDGLVRADIYVSDMGDNADDNWPQATYMAPRIMATLQKHGIISRSFEITIVPSREFNEKYALDFG